MSSSRKSGRLLHLPFRASRVERDVDEELAFHIEMRTEQLRAAGMSEESARAEAMRQFGDIDDARRYCRDMDAELGRTRRRTERWGDAMRDVRHAARGLRRQPGFTLTVVLTLALGIGANITMFGLVDRLLLRAPEHVQSPDLVRRLYFTYTRDGEEQTLPHISYPQLRLLQESMTSARVAGFYTREFAIGEGPAARQVNVTLASPEFFPALGVRPALGRFFTSEEDTPPVGSNVAVISHELWQGEFGSSPDVLSKPLLIAGRRFQVIGVAPRGFTGVNLEAVGAWVPISAMAGDVVDSRYIKDPWHQARNIGWLRAIARVPSASALRQSNLEATVALRRAIEARWGAASVDSTKPSAALEPLLLERGPDRTPSARIAVWLAGMSVVVLLIACANVANLLLARALRRRREIALRVALGAGRGRLVAGLITEGLLLALLGAAGAVFVARFGGGFVRRIILPDIAWGSSLIDMRMLAFTAGAAVLVGLLTGLVPALQASDPDLVGALKSGAREGGGRRSFTRSALVVAQAALSLLLLVGAGLFLRSLQNARSVELGFNADRVLSVELDLAGAGYAAEQSYVLYEQVHERLARLPGVQHAAISVATPFATNLDVDIGLPGQDSVKLPESGAPRINVVTDDYFATMGTRIVQGRAFTEQDRKGSTPVTIVNEFMARTLWPGKRAIGQCVILTDVDGKPCVEVVGIAQDVIWENLQEAPPMQMYVSMAQNVYDFGIRVIFLRTATPDPTALARAIRAEVREVAPRVTFADVRTLSQNIEPEMRPWTLGATMFTVFGALALVLAALGLYSVIAYNVAQRMHEMGVRIALGADTGSILRLVVGQGMRVAAIGIVLGGVVALLAGRWIGSLLFDTSPNDPLVLGAVTFTLLAVAVLASLIPAWRATRVSPGTALRAE